MVCCNYPQHAQFPPQYNSSVSWWVLGRVDSFFIVVNAHLAVNVPAIYRDFGLLWILATNTTQKNLTTSILLILLLEKDS